MILVAPHLVAAGLEIQHILVSGKVRSHEEMEDRLLRELDIDQPDMFRTRDLVMAQAYELQGRRIDRLHPRSSLLLRKPTLDLDHGGGLRLEVEARRLRLLEGVQVVREQ